MTGIKHDRGWRHWHGEIARRAAARSGLAQLAAIFLAATISSGAFAGEVTTWNAVGQPAQSGVIRSAGSVWLDGTGSLSDAVLAMSAGYRSGACAGLACPPHEPTAGADAEPLLDALVPDTDFRSPFTFGLDTP